MDTPSEKEVWEKARMWYGASDFYFIMDCMEWEDLNDAERDKCYQSAKNRIAREKAEALALPEKK